MDYKIEIIGGRYDGVPGLYWTADGSHPLPERILVGSCGKGVNCGLQGVCRKDRTHVSYWLPEEDHPATAQAYEKQNEYVARNETSTGDALTGRAVYAIGGLKDPKNFGAAAKEPVTA